MRWRLRRRPPDRPPAPVTGNGREEAAREALRRTEGKSRTTEERAVRGERLAEHVRRALGAHE